jgi:uncharacterized membrane protein YhaH (DUF805 family)
MKTKQCPFCGEEILAVAKKCKYCGEWLVSGPETKKTIPCPVCRKEIKEDLRICPECKEALLGYPQVLEKPKISGIDWYLKCFKQYADFKGRATETEHSMFTRVDLIFSWPLIILGTVLLKIDYYISSLIIFIIVILYFLATFLPRLAVAVRRLHDVGKNGWRLLYGIPFYICLFRFCYKQFDINEIMTPIFFISLILYIPFLIWMDADSDGDNQYGKNPLKTPE